MEAQREQRIRLCEQRWRAAPDKPDYERCWTPLQIRCGLVTTEGEPKYGFHKLRHAAASMFIQYLGWSPKRLQVVMGHSSIQMTFNTYGHLFENVESDRADMAKIENAVRSA